jgi:hypothetical protein
MRLASMLVALSLTTPLACTPSAPPVSAARATPTRSAYALSFETPAPWLAAAQRPRLTLIRGSEGMRVELVSGGVHLEGSAERIGRGSPVMLMGLMGRGADDDTPIVMRLTVLVKDDMLAGAAVIDGASGPHVFTVRGQRAADMPAVDSDQACGALLWESQSRYSLPDGDRVQTTRRYESCVESE